MRTAKVKVLALGACFRFVALSEAAGLNPSDGAAGDLFGYAVGVSGNMALVGAYQHDVGIKSNQGKAYVFRQVDISNGNNTQDLGLLAGDGDSNDLFGYSVALSGNSALVGAISDGIFHAFQGSAYVLRGVDTGSGNKTHDLKLYATDGNHTDYFGVSVSLSGNLAVVGAYNCLHGSVRTGASYVYRDVDTGTGNKTQDLKLIASDATANDYLGISVSLSGTTVLAGAYGKNSGAGYLQGAAYLYRNLDGGSGNKTQDLKLLASDAAAMDQFGRAVSLSGNIALIGAWGDDIGSHTDRGSAYVFRNVNSLSGVVTQDFKLTASDGETGDRFGRAVAISGSIGLVGAYYDDIGSNADQGSAYLFLNLDAGSANRTEDLKLLASDGAAGHGFGYAVSLDGDQWVVGAYNASLTIGKAYTGSVASLTTMNLGNATRSIDQVSFISRTDWIVGNTTSNNTVILTAGDSGNVTSSGKAVYVGKSPFSHNNALVISGNLVANAATVGDGNNTGNILEVNGYAQVPVTVLANSTLMGAGTIQGSILLSDYGLVSPGNHFDSAHHIGNITTGSHSWHNNAGYILEFKTDGTGTPGVDWDRLAINGTLTINATSANPLVVSLFTMSNSTTAGALSFWNPYVNHTWAGIVTTTGGISGFASDKFLINTSGFANSIVGNFSLELAGNNLNLVYTVPEPTIVGLLAGSAIFWCLFSSRCRQRPTPFHRRRLGRAGS